MERAGIYFHSCSCHNATKLAEYTSVEKARKAMEMLRDKYTGISDGYKDEDAVLYRERKSTDNFYFQFPSDDEVEVWDEHKRFQSRSDGLC